MLVDVWKRCQGVNYIHAINETAWGIIEAQEITSTRKLVDSFEEQVILEDLIESNKFKISTASMNFHPFLYTPFRYPPLEYGSRFGKRTEPSLWYGSLDLYTAMAEKAYYQFNFLQASEAIYEMVQVPLTVFSAQIKTTKGIHLTDAPFSDYTNVISSPTSYEVSQLLGTTMRDARVEAFTYTSARSTGDNINLALFSIDAFLRKNPDAESFQSWQCTVNNDTIEFARSSAMTSETIRFILDGFIVNGELPFSAN